MTKESKVTWAEAFRDMVVASIDHGQFPLMFVFLLSIIFISKLPNDDVSVLARELFESVTKGEMVFLFCFLITVAGWVLHVKLIKKNFEREYKRIGREKSELQEKLMGRKLKSSEVL